MFNPDGSPYISPGVDPYAGETAPHPQGWTTGPDGYPVPPAGSSASSGGSGSPPAPSRPTEIPWPAGLPTQVSASPPDSTPTPDSNTVPSSNSGPTAANPTPDTTPPGPANSTIAPDGTVTTTYGDGTTTKTTLDGTETTIKSDGSTNVNSTLPPPGSGLTTGPGATDPNDPQQGQQPIGFTHHELSPTTSTDPSKMVDPKATIGATETVSDLPNTAHVQGPTATGTGTGPHKPPNP